MDMRASRQRSSATAENQHTQKDRQYKRWNQPFTQPGGFAALHLSFLHNARDERFDVVVLPWADDLNCFARSRNSWQSRVLCARRSGSIVSLATCQLTAACASMSSI